MFSPMSLVLDYLQNNESIARSRNKKRHFPDELELTALMGWW